jgi:multidrug efflux pump
VVVGGGARPAVRAEVNPMQIGKLGVGLEQIRTALSNANANRPKGEIAGSGESWSIHANDQIFKANDYRSLIIGKDSTGSAIRLQDVAQVDDSVEDLRNIGLANGKPGVLMIISRQPGANIIATVDRVRALMPMLQASISPAIHLEIVLDRTTTIRASIADIEYTILISIVTTFEF